VFPQNTNRDISYLNIQHKHSLSLFPCFITSLSLSLSLPLLLDFSISFSLTIFLYASLFVPISHTLFSTFYFTPTFFTVPISLSFSSSFYLFNVSSSLPRNCSLSSLFIFHQSFCCSFPTSPSCLSLYISFFIFLPLQ